MFIDVPYPKYLAKQVFSADGKLSIIAGAWPKLSKALKAGILAMMRGSVP